MATAAHEQAVSQPQSLLASNDVALTVLSPGTASWNGHHSKENRNVRSSRRKMIPTASCISYQHPVPMTGPSVVWQHHTAAAASDRTSTVVGMTNAVLVSHCSIGNA